MVVLSSGIQSKSSKVEPHVIRIHIITEMLALISLAAFIVSAASLCSQEYLFVLMAQILCDLHPITNMSFYLGITCAIGILISHPVGYLLMFLPLFHQMEFTSTALFHAPRTSAFLINHSQAYHCAMILSIAESLIKPYVCLLIFTGCEFPTLEVLRFPAMIVLVAAQLLRSTAMITCGLNFTHQISYAKQQSHTLVTTGIYRILRHPSYTAFFYWACSLQILLLNPVSFIVYVALLKEFFSDRIASEEEILCDFFDEYEEYRKRTFVLIPLI